jgi:hypothetical protein
MTIDVLPTSRLPRHRKQVGGYFTAGDAELLKYLAEFHFLQPPDLEQLTGRFLHSIRRRLLALHRARLVDRLTPPVPQERPLPSPPAFVYTLARRGLERAKAFGFIDERCNYNDEKKTTQLLHDLEVSRFHIGLTLAARAGHWQLSFWEQRRSQLLDWALGPAGKLPVNPDALFALVDPGRPADRNTNYFFFELERVREHHYEAGVSALLRKAEAFERYARQGRHTEAWHFKNFRVVIVLPTPQRVRNVLAKLEEAELAFRRFWLTDLGSLNGPAGITGQIFQTPRDFRDGALYSLKPQ